MSDAMVTGRMPQEKKDAGNAVLARAGLNASQAINLMYDRLVEEQDVTFLRRESAAPSAADWAQASAFLSALVVPMSTRFDGMSGSELKTERLKSRGLM